MAKLEMAILDHNSAIGYHFRKDVEHPVWVQQIREENERVKVLAHEEMNQRIRITPIDEFSLVMFATVRFQSDGRWARKTASLLLSSPDKPVRWKKGLHALIKKSLETPALGGPIEMELEDIDLPTALAPYALVDLFSEADNTENIEFNGYELDEVMRLWSALPPDARMTTEVVLGSLIDGEPLANPLLRRFHLTMSDNQSRIVRPPFRSRFSLPTSEEGRLAVKKSLLLADKTGFRGQEWQQTVAAEAERRGSPIVAGPHLKIQLELVERDRDIARREVWRELVLKSLQSDIRAHSITVVERMGMLRPGELKQLSVEQQLLFVSTAMSSVHRRWSTEEEYWLEFLSSLESYVEVMPSTSMVELFQHAPFSQWCQHSPQQFKLLLRRVFTQYRNSLPSILDTIALGASDSNSNPALDQLIYDVLVETGVPLVSDLFDRIISIKFETKSRGNFGVVVDNHEVKTIEHDFHRFSSLNWADRTVALEALGARKVASEEQREALLDFLRAQSQRIGATSSKRERADFEMFIRTLERCWPKTVKPPRDLALFLAARSTSESIWFHTIMESRNRKDIQKLLSEADISLNGLSHKNLIRINTHRRRLRGWPSPFQAVGGFHDRDFLMATLSIDPNFAQRIHRVVGLLAGVISLALFLLWLNTTGWFWSTIPEGIRLNDWLGHIDSRVLNASKAGIVALFIAYRIRIRLIKIER